MASFTPQERLTKALALHKLQLKFEQTVRDYVRTIVLETLQVTLKIYTAWHTTQTHTLYYTTSHIV